MRHLPIVQMWIAIFRILFSDEMTVLLLIADLADDNLENASKAAQELGERGAENAVGPLLEALAMSAHAPETGDPHADAAQVDFRQDVVRALGKIGDVQAMELLRTVAENDPDAGVRAEAVTALARIKSS